MKTTYTCLPALTTLLLGACLLYGAPVQAGLLILGGTTSDAGVMTVASNPPPFEIIYSATDGLLEKGVFKAETIEDFVVRETDTGTIGLFLLPAGAVLQQLALTFGGTEYTEEITPLSADAGRKLLKDAARATRIDALAGQLDSVVIPLSLPAQAAGRGSVTVHWTLPMKSHEGITRLECPLPHASLTRAPVRRAVLTLRMQSAVPIRSVFSTSHACRITRPSEHEIIVRFARDGLTDDIPFALTTIVDPSPLGLRLFTHKPAGSDEGYFLLTGCPSGTTPQQRPKTFVFVTDTSGSMRGDKMEQARAALEYCLDQLRAPDLFNLISFADEVTRFRGAPAAVTPATIAAAKDFVDKLVPEGRTNLGDALEAAVSGADEAHDRLVILLTDGTPTVGQRNPDTILDRVKEVNTTQARVFAMGIGYEVNAHLLDRLAHASGGVSEYVHPEQDLDETVAALYNRIAHPVLLDGTLDFGLLPVADVTPERLAPLYRNQMLTIAGRYTASGSGTITLQNAQGEAVFQIAVDLPATQPENGFIAPLWAARRVGDTLEKMRLHGETDALMEDVVRISRRYGVVTEYTSVINDSASASLSDAEIATAAKQRLNRARQATGGRWGVSQTLNEKDLQSRLAPASEANTFLDESGEQQRADNIRQIGGTAYYLRDDGVWAPADDGQERTQRVVEKFSEEYFDLINRDKGFSHAVGLGDEVIIHVGPEQLIVK